MTTLEILEKLNTHDPERWYRMDSEHNNSFCWMFVASETKYSICGESDNAGDGFVTDEDCVGSIIVWLAGLNMKCCVEYRRDHFLVQALLLNAEVNHWGINERAKCLTQTCLKVVLEMYEAELIEVKK